jgi:hypothetical protein
MKLFRTFLILLGLALLVYWGIWQGYFQQDEWSGFGRVLHAQTHGAGSLIRFSGLHFTPLSIILVSVFYTLFGLNYAAYGWFSLLLHAINVFLVYLLTKKVTGKALPAFLAAIVFLTAFTPYQTVTWYAASLSFLPSAFFLLLSLLLFETYLEKKKVFILLFSFLCVIVGAFFRENAAFVIVYFPIRALLLRHPNFRNISFMALVAAGLYGAVRFVPLLFQTSLTTVAPHAERFRLGEIVSQGVTFLAFHLPTLLVPTPIPLELARLIFGDITGLARDSILAIFYGGVWIALTLFFLSMRKRIKATPTATVVLQSVLLFIALSLAPLSFFPPPLILEPRHYYLSSIGYALLMGYSVFLLLHKVSPKLKTLVIVLLTLVLSTNVILIRQEIGRIIRISSTRIRVINGLTALYPTLPEKTIIYAQGDMLPFQSGTGQMLMVLYRDRQDFTPLFQNYFLWGLNEQGYKEVEEKGFGFFTDFQQLMTAYCQNNLSPENVFAYSFDEKSVAMRDTSQEVRLRLACPF